jgi:hypothetical protein
LFSISQNCLFKTFLNTWSVWNCKGVRYIFRMSPTGFVALGLGTFWLVYQVWVGSYEPNSLYGSIGHGPRVMRWVLLGYFSSSLIFLVFESWSPLGFILYHLTRVVLMGHKSILDSLESSKYNLLLEYL